MMGRAFQKLAIPILGAIEPPGFLEGGGVTFLGEDTVVASLCDRANETRTRMLRDLVLGRDAKYFLEVSLPFGHIHIDGIFMALGEDLALVYQESFRVFPCRLYEAGPERAAPRHVRGLSRRAWRTGDTVDGPRARRGHLNVVVTKKSETAIGFESATRIAAEMAGHGWHLATFPAGELFLGNGGAHCMTCPVGGRISRCHCFSSRH